MHWFGIPGKVKLVHTIKQFGCITCPRLSLKRYIVGNMVYGPCLLAPLWIPWSSSGFHWCVKETSTRKYRHCVVVVTWATRTVRALQGSHNALYWVRTLLTLSYVFKQYEKNKISSQANSIIRPLWTLWYFVKRSPRANALWVTFYSLYT